ncbi:alpha/beta-hydrolase [Hysterangium stoloniferum]|nr:alpha/beta-hydrolase [Hysterangium stoloniferum]
MRPTWLLIVLPLVVASPIPIPSQVCDIPIIGRLLCQLFLQIPSISVNNPIGQPVSQGVIRYAAKYASAVRWQPPVLSTKWTPSIASDPTAMPFPCPQPGLSSSQVSEDCLDVVLYVPPSAKKTSGGIPTLVWVHGGSFIVGSASNPGLDGSSLAVATNSIVAVVQYRLGTFGLLPPSQSKMTSNLALQDLTAALTFLHGVLPSFGGSPFTPKLTLAGQSSGASLVRAMLGTPAVAPLFNNAWLHSDTLDYGFLTSDALDTLRGAWRTELACTSSNSSSCAQDMDVDTLIGHQSTLFDAAPALGAQFYAAEPIRPAIADGIFITHTFSGPESFPPSSLLKPIVVTTVKDDAATTIYSFFPDSNGPIPNTVFDAFIGSTLGPQRSQTVISSPFYSLTTTNGSSTDPRAVLSVMGTDLIWRCPAWKLSRDWAAHGSSRQYAGVFTQGISYPGNSAIAECVAPGAVCHQDDIEVLFGTGSSASPLTKELQARYSSFIRTNNPNANGYATWQPSTSTDAKALNLGGQAPIAVGACTPTFWGQEVPFDYQVNGE